MNIKEKCLPTEVVINMLVETYSPDTKLKSNGGLTSMLLVANLANKK